MFFKKNSAYEYDMEILATDANLVTFSATVKSATVTANSEGRKIVKAGSLIDATGKVVTQTGSGGSEALSTTPVGILYQTVDVTNGDMPCALVVEGYLRADRVIGSFAEAAKTKIKAALPNIKFR